MLMTGKVLETDGAVLLPINQSASRKIATCITTEMSIAIKNGLRMTPHRFPR